MADQESGASVLESWGPWQQVMEEAVTGCMVQLRKLEGALSHGGLDSMDEFSTDAMHLYHLADELTDRCEDVKLWRIARSEMQASSNNDF